MIVGPEGASSTWGNGMFRQSLTAALIALGLASAAGAADVSKFDIAGVHLGDTPATAQTALVKAGYKITAKEDQDSFESAVQRAIVQRRDGGADLTDRPQVYRSLTAEGPGRSRVFILFDALPQGPIVGSVRFEGNYDTLDEEAFRKQIVAKYGEPDEYSRGTMDAYWCSHHTEVCGDALSSEWNRTSYLNLTLFQSPVIQLLEGSDADHAVDAAVEAEVDHRAPKATSAPF